MMDYEKKYKEAVELMKDCVPDENGLVHVRPCDIFPELKESEDEKISKKVVDVLKLNIKGAESQMQASRGVDRTFEVYACNKVIAWLEKQGEQKSIEWSKEDRETIDYLIDYLESELDSSYTKEDKEEFTKEIELLKSLRPQSTWKPTEQQMKVLNEVINFAADHGTMRWNDYIYKVLKGLREQLNKL